MFPLKILNFSHSFKISFRNIVAVCSRFSHSVHCSFFGIISMPDPVRDTFWPSGSSFGDSDRSKFIRCVDGCKPEVNEVRILGKDVVAPKVHPTARVCVDAGFVCKFSTNYLT